MNDGVAMLLERMKTNPEEFVIEEGIVRKWDGLVRSYEGVLPPEDIKAYKEALNTLLQQQFTEKVMEELVDPKKLNPYLVQESATLSGGQTQGSCTLNSDAQTELMKAHYDAHLRALAKEVKEVKESPKTLFVRLFNYA